uniref:Uncharacterized protein n=1 Tax=Calcidiscus leptoporus TaxID=127549 RepID=A0A7S0IR15_9EUKA
MMVGFGSSHDALVSSARELLIDFERVNFAAVLSSSTILSPEAAGASGAALSGSPDSTATPIVRSDFSPLAIGESLPGVERNPVLLLQLDSLRDRLAAEEKSTAQLLDENARLSLDVRSLAQQLKQERAAGNAVLKRSMHAAPCEGAEVDAGEGHPTTNGLTLASAASQILMLRREVKFLQKQWNTARRDVEGSARRDELLQLQEQVAEAQKRATEAEASAKSATARQRTLIRELSSARAKLSAQHARIERRSAAQTEAAALRAQLHRVQEQLVNSQQQLKQRLLRDELRGGEAACNAITDSPLAERGGVGLAGAEALVTQLLLTFELGAIEQSALEMGAELAAMKAVRQDSTMIRLREAEEDRVRLTTELANALERLALFQEEKEMLRSNQQRSGDSSQAALPPKGPTDDLKNRAQSFAMQFRKGPRK